MVEIRPDESAFQLFSRAGTPLKTVGLSVKFEIDHDRHPERDGLSAFLGGCEAVLLHRLQGFFVELLVGAAVCS